MILYDILPDHVTDDEAALLAEVFMRLAEGIESHYSKEIERHYKERAKAAREEYLKAQHQEDSEDSDF